MRFLVLSLFAAFLLTACGANNQAPSAPPPGTTPGANSSGWTPALQSQYASGCQGYYQVDPYSFTASQAQAFCTCYLNQVMAHFTVAQFENPSQEAYNTISGYTTTCVQQAGVRN